MQATMSKTWIINLLLLVPVLRFLVVQAANGGLDPSNLQPCSLRNPLMDPTYEKRYGVDVVWQIPLNPKAVLIMAHGRDMDPFGYFDPGPKCKQCYGLPEDRTAVLEALRRKYAVISVKSIGRYYDTFDMPLEASEDLVLATTIITEWLGEHSLDGLPLATWGHSAGASMAVALTTRLLVRGLVLMCGSALQIEVQEMATPSTHPPTFFVYMPMDQSTLNITGEDAEAMVILRERGVEVTETQCWPRPLTPLFFSERILCMSDEMSRRIFAAYEAAGWLDSNGYLTKNPGNEDWRSVLLNSNALPFCAASGDLCLLRHVSEELRTAFASHSFTSGANDAIFPWLNSNLLHSSLSGGSSKQFE